MHIFMNRLSYDYADDGVKVLDAKVGLSTGMDPDGQHIYAEFQLKEADLGEGKTFEDMTPKLLFDIARKRLLEVAKQGIEVG